MTLGLEGPLYLEVKGSSQSVCIEVLNVRGYIDASGRELSLTDEDLTAAGVLWPRCVPQDPRSSGRRRSSRGREAELQERRNLGVAFYRTGMLEDAAREFDRVLELLRKGGTLDAGAREDALSGLLLALEVRCHLSRIGQLSWTMSSCTVGSSTLVLVAHDYKYDLPVLKHALATDVGYIGMLGSRRRGEAIPADPLSPRESEVVKLIAEAYTNKQIAETLKLSEKTVESHRTNVFGKLGMRDRVELVRYAIRRGLIEA